jgi:lipoprotein-anchoring transpeptidase ErfK/SrfK
VQPSRRRAAGTLKPRRRSWGAAAVVLVLAALLAAPAALARAAERDGQASRLAPLARVSVVGSGPIAVGAPGMETPLGLFYVQSRFVPSKYPILGAFAFETSGYSKLSDWPGGGVVGVHGTNTPWLIGQAVSHGCVRLRNSDVLALRKLVRVGTPVKIVAS